MKTKLLIATVVVSLSFVNNVSANIVSNSVPNYVRIDMNNPQQSLSAAHGVNLALITVDILQNNKKYLVDFSKIKSTANNITAKSQFYKSGLMSFNNDQIFISRYKNSLLFTPVNDNNFQLVAKDLNNLSLVEDKDLNNYSSQVPIKYFYIRDTTNLGNYCIFPSSFPPFSNPNYPINFCENPKMELIYKVLAARSLPGVGTLDSKFVRITLEHKDPNQITLNSDKLKLLATTWITQDSYSAIAQNYSFTIAARHDSGVKLLDAQPKNTPSNYQNTIIDIFQNGINPRTYDAKLPHFSDTATASYVIYTRLAFDTQNYIINRTSAPHYIDFNWERYIYPTAASILSHREPNRVVSENSFKKFVPNFSVAFGADPTELKKVDFFISSQVTIRPIYSFGEQEDVWQKTRSGSSFDIDFNHPVFSGGWPVNLQLTDFKNSSETGCAGFDKYGAIEPSSKCDLKSIRQSFLYDKQLRYRSIADISICLDAANLNRLSKCSDKPSQKWRWKDGYLHSNFQDKVLIYSKKDGSLLLSFVNEIPNGYSANLNTVFTKVIEN